MDSTQLVFDLFLFAMGLWLGAVLSFAYEAYRTRPLLRIDGEGGRGSVRSPVQVASVRIANPHFFFGIDLTDFVGGHTRLAEWFPSPTYRGLLLERQIAKKCIGMIVDKETHETIGGLVWASTRDGQRYVHEVAISSDASRELMLFAWLPGDNGRFFVFQPDPKVRGAVVVPPEPARLLGDREFELHVYYSLNRRFEATIRMGRRENGDPFIASVVPKRPWWSW
jgi:hypothetical protein